MEMLCIRIPTDDSTVIGIIRMTKKLAKRIGKFDDMPHDLQIGCLLDCM